MSPRRARFVEADTWFHVINRGVNRQRLFFEDTDYEHLLLWIRTATFRYPVACAGYCLMPNHFHLLLKPKDRGALAAFMRFATGCHACDVRAWTGTRGYGHVYQARYWSRPVETDLGFLLTLLYVEGNARRASLVRRAEDWRWGSLRERLKGSTPWLADPPFALPASWADIVNDGCTAEELEALRPAKRGRPRKKGTVPIS